MDVQNDRLGQLKLSEWPFLKVLQLVNSKIRVVEPQHADVLFYGCFGDKHVNYNCKKVWVIEEPIIPCHDECDYTISFEPDNLGGKNIHAPIWVWDCHPDWVAPVRNTGKYFCSAVFSNHEQTRMQFKEKLSNLYKPVDHYGRSATPLHHELKLDTISNYRFNMCFENTVLNGYCTEKLLHAKLAGCVPIYYGDRTGIAEFNQESFLNLLDFENMEHLIETVKELDQDKNKFEQIKNEPLFPNDYKNDIYSKYIDRLSKVFN